MSCVAARSSVSRWKGKSFMIELGVALILIGLIIFHIGLVLVLIELSWWLRPERVRQWWLQRVARRSKDPEQRATAVRLLAADRSRDLHS